MNRGQLIQVNGKKEKAQNGRVVVQKKEEEEPEKFLKKTVQFFSCQPKVTYEVKGKCNTVQIMDSKDCTLEVDTVVSGVEVTNCKNVTVKVKGDSELWTCTANKTSGLVIELNETVVKGGQEFISSGDAVSKKVFQLIGAAVSDIKVNRAGKVIAIPDHFSFKVDMAGPTMTHTTTSSPIKPIKKGVEMSAEGEGFSIGEGQAKGKTVFVSKKQGKGKDLELTVNGTANNVVLEGCKRVLLSVGTVQKEIQVIDCKQVKVVVKEGGKVPKVSIKNSHGCYMTLGDNNPDFTVVACQYSDMNMNFPFGANSDKKELSMREQWVYTFEGDKAKVEEPTF